MQQVSYTSRSFKAVCSVVLVGSYCVVGAISILLLINIRMGGVHTFGPLIVCGGAFLYLFCAQLLARLGRQRAAAYLLVSFYGLLATGIVWSWGINTPIAMLIFALVIVLAGILLTARDSLFAALASGIVLIASQAAITLNWHKPNTSWTGNTSNFGDVFGYCVGFGMLELVSWLYNRQMERSLAQAEQAQSTLLRQKATLKLQVEERTAKLRQVQLEEMRQMYRFAELGQSGITLLHDLANHLTTLILEVEGVRDKQQSRNLARTREIISYLEEIVGTTRERLQNGSTQEQRFSIVQKARETLAFLNYKAVNAGVTIDWQPPAASWQYTGDPISFCQVIAILTSNAIDAYNAPEKTDNPHARTVAITMERNKTHIIIKISDWGRGITKSKREDLFKPHHSTKKSGLGLGLYIAKQTVEMQFSGEVVINSRSKHTEFIIMLPLQHEN